MTWSAPTGDLQKRGYLMNCARKIFPGSAGVVTSLAAKPSAPRSDRMVHYADCTVEFDPLDIVDRSLMVSSTHPKNVKRRPSYTITLPETTEERLQEAEYYQN
jgi:hypothetical protein